MASESPRRVPPGSDPGDVGQESLRAVIESNFDGMVVIDHSGAVLFVNPAAERLLDRPAAQVVGAQFGFPYAPGGAIEIEIVAGGAHRVAEMRVVAVEWEGTRAFLASLRDVTDRKRGEEQTQRLLATIVEQSRDAIFAFDLDGVITAWNGGAERMLGHAAPDALGQNVTFLVPVDRVAEERELVRQVLAGESVEYETKRVHADRTLVEVSMIISPLRVAGGAVAGASAIARDATERNRIEQQLEHLATHDPLTGLLNRRAFETELARAVAFVRRYEIGAVLLMLDVDHFKYINDSYGHALGDATIRHVSDLLQHRLRSTDVVCRLGGDEFALILPGTDPARAQAVVRALLDELRKDTTIRSGSEVVRLTASVGLTAIQAGSRLTPEELLARADIALYQAKEAGRDRMAETDFSASDGPALFTSRLGGVERIRDALEHDAFVLHEQPIMNLGVDTVERVELLIRMRTNNQELVPPAAFLPVAERFGLIRAIDQWVIDRALQLLRESADARILHVNLSGATMTDPGLLDTLPAQIAREATDPTRLAFEITETVAIQNIEHAHQLSQRLAALGCQIVLDDFGSGFGSFYYLKHLPFHSLKIDGEFVKKITTDKADRVTVQAIIEMAHGLGKTAIAECIENQPTLDVIRQLGADYAQGHHLGKPAPSPAATLADSRSPAVRSSREVSVEKGSDH
jgi:diguanylate cyclase (GGDEF)-like protein/PAS domain S-box-containing protein